MMGIRLSKSDVEFLTSLRSGTCVHYLDARNSFTGVVVDLNHDLETHITAITVNNITSGTGKYTDREQVHLSLSQWGSMKYSDVGAVYQCHATRATVTFELDGC